MDYAVGPPPEGGAQDRGHQIIAIDSVIVSISWSMVILRLITRTWITRNLGWDDATILFAAMTNSVGLGYYMSMVFYGLGRHKYYLSNYDFKEFLKYDYLDWIQAFITLAVSKVSICLLLLRLSKFSRLKTVLYALIAFLALTHVPLTIMIIFQCNPISEDWNPGISGHCWSKSVAMRILIAQGVFSIVTDFVGVTIPIMLLWNIQMKTRSKIAIWLLMGFGVVTGITCIIRTSLTPAVESSDLAWDAVGVSLAKCLEVNFGIMAACLPLMKPLVTYLGSIYFGEVVDLRHRNHHQQTDLTHAQRSLGPWQRLQGSISAIRPLWASRRVSRDQETLGEQPELQRFKRQYAWTQPLPRLPSRAMTTEKRQRQGSYQNQAWEEEGLELPIQGIRKTTRFRFESTSPTEPGSDNRP